MVTVDRIESWGLTDPRVVVRHAEVDGVRRGAGRIHVVVAEPVILLGYELGSVSGTAPYSWHLVPAERRQMPPHGLSEEQRAVLTIVLVDSATGLVRAIRAVSISPHATRVLHAAIAAQSAATWDMRAYDARLFALYVASDRELIARASASSRVGA